MVDKPILMIHEINKPLLDSNINFEEYVLTFDDCLYSQYYYWDFFRNLETTKILFVTCSFIHRLPLRDRFKGNYIEFPTCEEALNKRFKDPYNYMSLEEIIYLINSTPDLIIGGHGHSHTRIEKLSDVGKISEFQKDIRLMVNWFELNLNISPQYYCYPFNYDDIKAKNAVFKKYNIKHVYGKERIDVRTLL